MADEVPAEPSHEADDFLDESPFRSSLRSVLVVDLAALSLWTAWSHPGPNGISRLALVGVWSAPAVWNLATRSTLRRLAFRRMQRSKRESMLIVACIAIVTTLLTLSTALADSVTTSARTAVDNQLGSIDEMIVASTPELRVAAQTRLDETLARRSDTVNDLSLIVRGQIGFVVADAVLRHTTTGTTDTTGATDTAVIARDVSVIEMDVAAAGKFGTDPSATGLADVTRPESGHMLLGPFAASALGVHSGDTVTMLDSVAGDRQFIVDLVLPKRGFGVLPIDGSATSRIAIVPIGAMTTMTQPPPLRYVIAIANRNGSRSSDAATEQLEAAFRSSPASPANFGRESPDVAVTVDNVKAQILQQAVARTRPVSRLLKTIAMLFGLSAGLLLITLFYGLAVARTSEVGALRSVGLRRRDAVAAFGIEGWCYSLAGSLIGAAIGVGATVLALGRTSAGGGIATVENGPHLRALWIGLACGTVLASAALAVSMLLTTRGTIQRSAGATGETTPGTPLSRGAVMGLGAIAVWGAMLILRSLNNRGSFGFLSGVLLLVTGTAVIARNRRRGKVALLPVGSKKRVVGLIVLGIAVAVGPSLVPSWFRDTGTGSQVLQAVALLTVCSLLAREFAPLFVLPQKTDTNEGRRRAARTLVKASPGMAPNRDTLLRTTIAALVMALTVIGFTQKGLGSELATRVRAAKGGWQTMVETADPKELPGVIDSLPADAVTSEFTVFNAEVGSSEGRTVRVNAMRLGADYLDRTPMTLSERGAHLATDRAVFDSLVDTSGTIVVDENLFADGGTRLHRVHAGQTLFVRDLRTGRTQSLKVVGVARGTAGLAEILVGTATAFRLSGEGAPVSRFLLATTANSPGALAEIRRALDRPGVTRMSIEEAANADNTESRSVLRSLGWLEWLGGLLVLGAVSVLIVRAVADRNAEWAVLRSLGMSSAAIRRIAASESLQLLAPAVIAGIVVGGVVAQRLVWAGSLGANASFRFSIVTFVAAVAVVLVPLLAAVAYLRKSLMHDAPLQRGA